MNDITHNMLVATFINHYIRKDQPRIPAPVIPDERTNSYRDFKFSVVGAVTKIFEYLHTVIRSLEKEIIRETEIYSFFILHVTHPAAIAPAIPKPRAEPRAADFPRPRAAVSAVVLWTLLSKMASRNLETALPYLTRTSR